MHLHCEYDPSISILGQHHRSNTRDCSNSDLIRNYYVSLHQNQAKKK